MHDRQVRMLVVMGALTIVLGGLYLFSSQRSPEIEWDARATIPILKAELSEVERVLVEHRDGWSVDVQRAGDRWIFPGPDAQPADPDAMAAGLDALERLSFAIPIKHEGETEAFGLGTSPVAKMTVSIEGKKPIVLSLGHPVPVGWMTYGALEDGEVLAVRGRLDETWLQGPDWLRDRGIVSVPIEELSEVILRSERGVLRVVRTADDRFMVDGYGPADPNAVERLAVSATNLRIGRFMDKAIDGELTEPRVVLEVVGRTGARDTIRFGDPLPMGQLAQSDAGQVGVIHPDAVAFLRQGPSDVLVKSILLTDAYPVSAIEVKHDGPWRVVAMTDALKAVVPRPEPQGDTDDGWGQIRLTFSDNRVVTYRLGAPREGLHAVLDDASGISFGVSALEIEALFAAASDQPAAGENE